MSSRPAPSVAETLGPVVRRGPQRGPFRSCASLWVHVLPQRHAGSILWFCSKSAGGSLGPPQCVFGIELWAILSLAPPPELPSQLVNVHEMTSWMVMVAADSADQGGENCHPAH